jgi:CheY-like chemotaxis protein
VLIVDDDPVFLMATASKLTSAGFTVSTAREGAEAIQVLGEAPVHIVLLDINLPTDAAKGGLGSWDGFQALFGLGGMPPAQQARFIMVSTVNTPTDRKRAHALGAMAYFQKPLDHDQLLAVINAGS